MKHTHTADKTQPANHFLVALPVTPAQTEVIVRAAQQHVGVDLSTEVHASAGLDVVHFSMPNFAWWKRNDFETAAAFVRGAGRALLLVAEGTPHGV